VTRHGFTQVPNFILTKKDISVGAKLAYAMLLKYAWDNGACFPGQVKLAEDTGAGERSVRTYLKELEGAGLLEITQRGLGKNEPVPALLDGEERPRPPPQTGKFRRSGTATVAATDRQIPPITQ